MKKYDVIVIGAGSAGLGASGVAKAIGLSTLIIEKEAKNVGGDCLNYGCVPSKAIIHVSKMIHNAKQVNRFGISSSGKVDITKVMDYIHEKQNVIRAHENAEYLKTQGFDVKIGHAKFISKNQVKVGEDEFQAKLIFLCTGSKPRFININGQENVKVYTNESLFFEMKKLPEHFLIVGGGPIGCEMAQAFQRLGSKVSIINRGSRILSKERGEISGVLESRFKEEGINVYNNATLENISTEKKGEIKFKDGETNSIPVDAILLAVGRVVRTKGMDLEKANITIEKGKFVVNDFLQSTNKNVYILGDAAGKYMFSHGAEKMVRLAWRNILIPFWKKKDSVRHLSWVTFTDPQVATFGLSEEEMNERGIKYWRQDQNFTDDDRAIVDEYTYAKMSLYFETNSSLKNRRIIGGTMIAPNAGEMIQELELASLAEIPISTFFNKVYPYPVGARINQKTIRGIYEGAFKNWQKKLAVKFFRLFY